MAISLVIHTGWCVVFRSLKKNFLLCLVFYNSVNDNFFHIAIKTSLPGLGACHMLDSFSGAIVSSSQESFGSENA